jgi:pSer/pThr/pTyr-binding forkhead associated (FHA) protein
MSTETLIFRGLNGVVEGECFPLDYGKSVVVGRSSKADISLKKCRKYKEMSAEDRKKDEEFLKVSRHHLRISFYNSQSVELEDKSQNGTFVDGIKIEKLVISDIKDRPREVSLGPGLRFRLEWGSVETLPAQPLSAEAGKAESQTRKNDSAKKSGSKAGKSQEGSQRESKDSAGDEARKSPSGASEEKQKSAADSEKRNTEKEQPK